MTLNFEVTLRAFFELVVPFNIPSIGTFPVSGTKQFSMCDVEIFESFSEHA